MIMILIVSLLLLAEVFGNNRSSQSMSQNKVSVTEAQKEHIARGIASGFGSGPFQPSLEMKENIDFLLTPALIIQEAFSENIIITYPTE
jgi:hypothetical protein